MPVIVRFTILLTVAMSFTTCTKTYSGKQQPLAKKGILDLRGWDFDKDGPVKLDGEWEFYWEKLLYLDDFRNEKSIAKTGLIALPSVWNGYLVNDKKLTYEGFATFRITILPANLEKVIAVKTEAIGTAFRLYANGELVAANGRVGSKATDSEPRFLPVTSTFPGASERIELILQVSNFHYIKGGPWTSLYFGSARSIRERRETGLVLELFLFGCLSIMGIYHFGLFLSRRKEKSTLYFGLLCLLIALRILLTGEKYLIHIFPYISWSMALRIEFLDLYLTLPVFVLFCRAVFPQENLKYLARFFLVTGCIFPAITVFAPALLYSKIAPAFQILTLLFLIYFIYLLVISLIRRRAGSAIFLAGSTGLIMTVCNDILHFNGIIHTGYYGPFGLLVFIFSQAAVLSSRFSGAFFTVEKLSDELMRLGDIKDKFLSNLSHELRTPLSIVYGYSEILAEDLPEGDLKSHSKEILHQSDKLRENLNDLMLVTEIESVPGIERKTMHLANILKRIETELKIAIEKNHITVKNNIPEQTILKADESYITSALYNIFKNGIVYNSRGGILTINAGQQNSTLTIEFSDTGPGIPIAAQLRIWEKFYRADSSLTCEVSGVGLGLFIAKRIIELHAGSIRFETGGEGTTFFIELPVE